MVVGQGVFWSFAVMEYYSRSPGQARKVSNAMTAIKTIMIVARMRVQASQSWGTHVQIPDLLVPESLFVVRDVATLNATVAF
jgi:hypothetical protein